MHRLVRQQATSVLPRCAEGLCLPNRVFLMEIFGVSLPGLLSQLLLGLVNGSFYAILSLGLAVIFGLLNVINFAHGALFMMGPWSPGWP